ncbi:Ig-like domain-containing protein [Winogradskyella sp. A2]|uniref:Ig-like domain-containing protein n=1 Tax=Winogradskyella sp. A2 TaxID=3366944 RepID=UPI00398C5AFC
MKKNFFYNFFITLCLLLFSCETDDSAAILEIDTNSDSVVLAQNSQIEIFIFQNDQNIPSLGQLSFSNPEKGIIISNDNGTSNDPSDDSLIFKATPNLVGEDAFQYTICDNSENCKTESVSITITSSSVVNVFSGTPHQTLSAYNFFESDLRDLSPSFGVIPYDLISPLFSDYAKKKRFIWMPNGVKANYVDDYSPLDFPIGTFLIKNFFYNTIQPNNTQRILETRIMFKTDEGWDFANYLWNEEQTEAFFSNNGDLVELTWLEGEALKSTNYRIPSRAECFTCHNQSDSPTPIGLRPQNINKNYDYDEGTDNQLRKLISVGYLDSDIPGNINTTVTWDDNSNSLEERVRSYLDINCAHCHSDNGYCNYRPMRFAYNLTDNRENIGVCVEPETQFIPNSDIVKPNDTDLSILYYRLSTTDESFRMPLLGRTINHDEGVELIEEWINSLTNCD